MIISKTLFKLLIVITLVTSFILLSSHLVEKAGKKVVNAKMATTYTYKIHADILMLRRHEKDFLMRHDITQPDKFENTYNVMKKDIAQLQSFLDDLQLLQNQGEALEQILVQYANQFHEILAIQLGLGLTYDDGLCGKLREQAHHIEANIALFPSPELMNALLMIRRFEKDFMLRTTTTDLAQWKNKVHEFKNLILKHVSSKERQERLLSITNSYENYLQQFAAAMAKKGFTNRDGLWFELTSSAHLLEQSLKSMTDDLLQISNHAELTTHRNTLYLMFAFVPGILVICLLPFLTSVFSKRINQNNPYLALPN